MDTSQPSPDEVHGGPAKKGLRRETDLSALEVGDQTPNGDTIDFVYHRSRDLLIYRNMEGSVNYSEAGGFGAYKAAFTEFRRVQAEAEEKLRGTYREGASRILASCLRSALLCDDVANLQSYFDPFRKYVEEKGPIERIYAYDDNFMVYLNKQGYINYEYKTLSPELLPAQVEFYRLQQIARSSLPNEDKSEINALLGNELAAVFRSPAGADLSSFFVSSKEFITNRSEAVLRSEYIRASTFSALALLLLLAPVCYYLKAALYPAWIIVLGSMGGVIGASISIIQRGGSLKVNAFVPVSHVVFQGLIRVLLGIIFGALLVVAARANITLGIINDNNWSLFIFSVVAGFSERLIPDILERIATNNDAGRAGTES